MDMYTIKLWTSIKCPGDQVGGQENSSLLLFEGVSVLLKTRLGNNKIEVLVTSENTQLY